MEYKKGAVFFTAPVIYLLFLNLTQDLIVKIIFS